MELREHKLEIGIAVLFVILLGGLFRMFGGSFKSSRLDIGNISYEMPRPKTDMVGEFALGDREIDRRYRNPFGRKEAASPTAKGSADNVKAALKPTQDAKKSQGQWVVVRHPKKTDSELRVIEKAKDKGLSKDSDSPVDSAQNGWDGYGKSPKNKSDAEPKSDEDTLSPGQWMALLTAQPTKENMDKLVAAYAAKKVEAETFYAVVESLLSAQDDDRQLLAIYGLSRYPEATGFAMVARKMPDFSENVEATATAYLYSFSAPARHGALRVALQSGDPAVSYMAAQVILDGASNQNGTRPGRGGSNATQVSSFLQFVPIFKQLEQNGNDELKSLASQFLGLFPQIASNETL